MERLTLGQFYERFGAGYVFIFEQGDQATAGINSFVSSCTTYNKFCHSENEGDGKLRFFNQNSDFLEIDHIRSINLNWLESKRYSAEIVCLISFSESGIVCGAETRSGCKIKFLITTGRAKEG